MSGSVIHKLFSKVMTDYAEEWELTCDDLYLYIVTPSSTYNGFFLRRICKRLPVTRGQININTLSAREKAWISMEMKSASQTRAQLLQAGCRLQRQAGCPLLSAGQLQQREEALE